MTRYNFGRVLSMSLLLTFTLLSAVPAQAGQVSEDGQGEPEKVRRDQEKKTDREKREKDKTDRRQARQKVRKAKQDKTKRDSDKASSQKVGKKDKKDKKDKKESSFLRVRRDKKGNPLFMETSIVTYKPAGKKNKGVTIHLVGAVHIGEKDYYQRLNRQFTRYDVLLYELVAPEGTRVPKGGGRRRGGSLIGSLQVGMKDLLGLEFQLEQVDYTKKNFVHADMSPKEFNATMKKKGESWLQMFFRMMGQSMAMQAKRGGASDFELMVAILSRDKTRIKRLMASQFEDMETAMSALEGPNGSTIITERNKKCLSVLSEQIAAGKKKIGIFYGAGHLPDMERRLIDEFGMKRTRVKWLPAWKLTSPKARKSGKKRSDTKKPKKSKSEKGKSKSDKSKSDKSKSDKS